MRGPDLMAQGRYPGEPERGGQRQLRPEFYEQFGCDRLTAHLGLLSMLHGRNQARQPKPAAGLASPRLVLPFWPHRLPRLPAGRTETTPWPPACSASPRKNPGRCDLLHISRVGLGLDRRHEQRDPNLIRRAGRPPHRLRPDRHRRWGRPGCAGLSPAGLNPSPELPACVNSRASPLRLRGNPSGSRVQDFPWHGAAASRPSTVPPKSVKRGGCRSCQSSTILTERLIATSFRFRFGVRRRFIPAPHLPKKIAKHARPWP